MNFQIFGVKFIRTKNCLSMNVSRVSYKTILALLHFSMPPIGLDANDVGKESVCQHSLQLYKIHRLDMKKLLPLIVDISGF
jgi:hypothetical protein